MKLNVLGLLLAASIVTLINTDNVLITNLNLSDGAMSALKLVAYLASIAITWYNEMKFIKKLKTKSNAKIHVKRCGR